MGEIAEELNKRLEASEKRLMEMAWKNENEDKNLENLKAELEDIKNDIAEVRKEMEELENMLENTNVKLAA
jgi:hypothetical protein